MSVRLSGLIAICLAVTCFGRSAAAIDHTLLPRLDATWSFREPLRGNVARLEINFRNDTKGPFHLRYGYNGTVLPDGGHELRQDLSFADHSSGQYYTVRFDAAGRLVRLEMREKRKGDALQNLETLTYDEKGRMASFESIWSGLPPRNFTFKHKALVGGRSEMTWIDERRNGPFVTRSVNRVILDAAGRALSQGAVSEPSGSYTPQIHVVYNERGDIASRESKGVTWEFEYTYDDVGNWISRKSYKIEDGRKLFRGEAVRNISYGPESTAATSPPDAPSDDAQQAKAVAEQYVRAVRAGDVASLTALLVPAANPQAKQALDQWSRAMAKAGPTLPASQLIPLSTCQVSGGVALAHGGFTAKPYIRLYKTDRWRVLAPGDAKAMHGLSADQATSLADLERGSAAKPR